MMLNDLQKEAVYTNEKNVFLLAGAGTGKTRVIVERIKHLIANGVSKNDILGITFTRKAALEMKNRIGQNNSIELMTFHQLAYYHLNYDNKIFDDDNEFERNFLLAISKYKNKSRFFRPFGLKKYNEYLANHQMIDFDDLLNMYLQKLRTDNVFCQTERRRYKYIFIDEFQDTNQIQYEIIKELATSNTHFFAVGDPDQSIYAFRGGEPSIINKYVKDFKAIVLLININYRSKSNIIDYANKTISSNFNRIPKTLLPSENVEGIIKTLAFEDNLEETKNIYELIKLLNKQYDSIAILSRTRHRLWDLINLLEDDYYNQKIQLLTIHEAKGLEFDVVILLGLEEGHFPNLKENRISVLFEERRLMFVAITRAKKELYITHCQIVDGYRKRKSRFIKG